MLNSIPNIAHGTVPLSQGFMVSLLFCFLNSDVIDIIKKKFSRIKVRFQESSMRVRRKEDTSEKVPLYA